MNTSCRGRSSRVRTRNTATGLESPESPRRLGSISAGWVCMSCCAKVQAQNRSPCAGLCMRMGGRRSTALEAAVVADGAA